MIKLVSESEQTFNDLGLGQVFFYLETPNTLLMKTRVSPSGVFYALRIADGLLYPVSRDKKVTPVLLHATRV